MRPIMLSILSMGKLIGPVEWDRNPSINSKPSLSKSGCLFINASSICTNKWVNFSFSTRRYLSNRLCKFVFYFKFQDTFFNIKVRMIEIYIKPKFILKKLITFKKHMFLMKLRDIESPSVWLYIRKFKSNPRYNF